MAPAGVVVVPAAATLEGQCMRIVKTLKPGQRPEEFRLRRSSSAHPTVQSDVRWQ